MGTLEPRQALSGGVGVVRGRTHGHTLCSDWGGDTALSRETPHSDGASVLSRAALSAGPFWDDGHVPDLRGATWWRYQPQVARSPGDVPSAMEELFLFLGFFLCDFASI